jgi:hypothetical protein
LLRPHLKVGDDSLVENTMSTTANTVATAEAQGIREGTLRTSHREQHAVKRKPAPRPLADKARALVDGLSQGGTIIRQRLDLERMKQPLQKGLFYVAENDGQAETGFLVFLPGAAPVFFSTKPKAPPPAMLRMRVSPAVAEGGGSVLVASLDSVQHTLRLEDVWQWRGERLFDTCPYSGRRKALKEFVERFWIPDARLMSGIVTTVVNPVSLEVGLETLGSAHTADIFPEQAGRRRLWFEIAGRPQASAAAAQPAQQPRAQRPATAVAPQQAPQPQPQTQAPIRRTAFAKAVPDMPDIYDLYDDAGFPISRASVQKFSVSQQLRSAPVGTKGTNVHVEWRQDFGGYEIAGLV